MAVTTKDDLYDCLCISASMWPSNHVPGIATKGKLVACLAHGLYQLPEQRPPGVKPRPLDIEPANHRAPGKTM